MLKMLQTSVVTGPRTVTNRPVGASHCVWIRARVLGQLNVDAFKVRIF